MSRKLLRVIGELASAILALVTLFPCLKSFLDKLAVGFATYGTGIRSSLFELIIQLHILCHLRSDLINLVGIKSFYCRLKIC